MEKETGFEPFENEAEAIDFIIACVAGWLGDKDQEKEPFMVLANEQAKRAILLLEDWKNSL